MASVADNKHFGLPSQCSLLHIFVMVSSIFINPFLFMMVIYTLTGCWMWQFDGQLHSYNINPETTMKYDTDRQTRPVTLWWALVKSNQ